MTRVLRLLVILVVTVNISFNAAAQVLVDVKTKYSEKKELHFIKLALMTSLDTTSWARTTEIGENFSLWLKNYRCHFSGDSMCSECDLEVHPPALATEGECLRSSHLSVAFDTSGLSAQLAPSDSVVARLMLQNLMDSSMLTKFLRVLGVNPSNLAGHPVMNYLARQFVSNFVQLFDRRPNALEVVEASLLCSRALLDVRSFVEQQYPRAIRR